MGFDFIKEIRKKEEKKDKRTKKIKACLKAQKQAFMY